MQKKKIATRLQCTQSWWVEKKERKKYGALWSDLLGGGDPGVDLEKKGECKIEKLQKNAQKIGLDMAW